NIRRQSKRSPHNVGSTKRVDADPADNVPAPSNNSSPTRAPGLIDGPCAVDVAFAFGLVAATAIGARPEFPAAVPRAAATAVAVAPVHFVVVGSAAAAAAAVEKFAFVFCPLFFVVPAVAASAAARELGQPASRCSRKSRSVAASFPDPPPPERP